MDPPDVCMYVLHRVRRENRDLPHSCGSRCRLESNEGFLADHSARLSFLRQQRAQLISGVSDHATARDVLHPAIAEIDRSDLN